MKSAISAVGLLVLGFLAESTIASCGHGTSLLRRKVTLSKRQEGGEQKKTVEVGKFGYSGTQGPAAWAGLAAENAGCAISTTQSPIDVTNTSTTLVAPGTLQMNFPSVESAEFENIGTTIEVVMEGKNASTTVNGKDFALKQFHFHSPSEHTINGEYFPLEMHMVHEAADGSIAVIAAQFQLTENSETTSLLTSVVSNIGAISAPGSITETGALDFAPLVTALNAQSLSTYSGSLTTPPCAEGLTFFVTSQQLPLDVATYNKIKAVVGFNARFTQNAAGQENLLSVASKQIAANAAAGAVPGAPVAAPVEKIDNVLPPSKVEAGPGRVTATPKVDAPAVVAPPAGLAPPASNGNVQVIGGAGGATGLTPETLKLIEGLTGVKVPSRA